MHRRVLIVDDNFGDRMILRDYLTSLGYQVVGEARHGAESLESYEKLKPDVVVMDTAMPHMDGITAARKIIQKDREAVIIMCTGQGQRALALEAMAAGARDFITKPINIRRLRRVLHFITG